ncbi:hypothetical protein ONZ51_g12976 [Trametes cubensis]|uniref:YCII-related domain-containing protein n=1 Tax=Trametes cubensis TaxID=1111947 RepID=A0AAD7TF84_9APHY|nr:hypothetical protein ONZ51_g12976 [Trametes cubensis]
MHRRSALVCTISRVEMVKVPPEHPTPGERRLESLFGTARATERRTANRSPWSPGPTAQIGEGEAGGGLLPPSVLARSPGAADQVCGGFLIVKAESIGAVWALIKADVFWTSGEVWDREKVIVAPAYIVMPEAKFD